MFTQNPFSRRRFDPVLLIGSTYINICMYAALSASSGLGLGKAHRQCQQAKHPYIRSYSLQWRSRTGTVTSPFGQQCPLAVAFSLLAAVVIPPSTGSWDRNACLNSTQN